MSELLTSRCRVLGDPRPSVVLGTCEGQVTDSTLREMSNEDLAQPSYPAGKACFRRSDAAYNAASWRPERLLAAPLVAPPLPNQRHMGPDVGCRRQLARHAPAGAIPQFDRIRAVVNELEGKRLICQWRLHGPRAPAYNNQESTPTMPRWLWQTRTDQSWVWHLRSRIRSSWRQWLCLSIMELKV
jgi:hypothetical protein